jgi:hypothetical protein
MPLTTDDFMPRNCPECGQPMTTPEDVAHGWHLTCAERAVAEWSPPMGEAATFENFDAWRRTRLESA